MSAINNIPLWQLLQFAKSYSQLGSAVQEQLDQLIEDENAEVNPNAIQMVLQRLRPLPEEIKEYCEGYLAKSGPGMRAASAEENLRARLVRLAHTRPELRADLLPLLTDKAACGWAGGEAPVMAKFEEGKSVDPTKNMSPEDAAEWKKQNAIHRDNFTKGAGTRTDGHGPASDGRYYHVALMKPQAGTGGTGPWLVASIRGVPNSGFAIQIQQGSWNALIKETRLLVGADWNEAHKVMYERAKMMNRPHHAYDPQWGTIAGITPSQDQG